MNNSIVPASTAIQSFRDAGYKNTASALAELLDNSIEAEAENIQIITLEKQVQLERRLATQISEILIYDDGIGMSPETLAMCLQFGNGTRLSSREGIGRFGIGLPNASVSQCARVEVYSWQGGKCYFTYLDVKEIADNKQEKVNDVVRCEMPTQLLANIEGKFGENGSLVVWKKCDRLDIARASTLFKRMEKNLCRVYRHFLDTDDKYGRRRKFKLINYSDGAQTENRSLKANDPLYLMTPNTLDGQGDMITNIAHGDPISVELPYNSKGDVGVVEIRFSVAKPETQALGGGGNLGRHYRTNTGISFVRAAREIDFGVFGYFNPRDERHRWWGCEVRFEPEFDEVFGVTNNKQAVRGISYLDLKEFKEDHDDWKSLISEDPRLKLRQELSRVISHNLKQLEEVIKSRGKNQRKTGPGSNSEVGNPAKIANSLLDGATKKTASQTQGATKSEAEKKSEWATALLGSDTSLTDSEAAIIAETKVDLVVEKTFESWPGAQFFSVKTTGSTCNLQINRNHPFFTEMYEPLTEASEHKYIDALDLLLMGYARTQDELYYMIDDIEEINNTWGGHVKKFLKKLSNDA